MLDALLAFFLAASLNLHDLAGKRFSFGIIAVKMWS
jgi:hypothetical protein